MNEEQGEFFEALVGAYVHCRAEMTRSGREIDQEFIRQGFVVVQAEIDMLERVYGEGSYELYIDCQSDAQRFEEMRRYTTEVAESLEAVEKEDNGRLAGMWDVVLSNKNLVFYSKELLLIRFFENRYGPYILSHLGPIRIAQREQNARLSTFYPPPSAELSDEESIVLRKRIYNTVMADTFGPLGFSRYKQKKGLDLYRRQLDHGYSIIILPDVQCMERVMFGFGPAPWKYSGMNALDMTFYLAREDNYNERIFPFLPIHNCLAMTWLRDYDNASSLEVAIRANALWRTLQLQYFDSKLLAH